MGASYGSLVSSGDAFLQDCLTRGRRLLLGSSGVVWALLGNIAVAQPQAPASAPQPSPPPQSPSQSPEPPRQAPAGTPALSPRCPRRLSRNRADPSCCRR